MSDWISVEDELPPDDSPVYVQCMFRFKRYKSNSQQAKSGAVGRWQKWNGFGWTNTDEEVASWLRIDK